MKELDRLLKKEIESENSQPMPLPEMTYSIGHRDGYISGLEKAILLIRAFDNDRLFKALARISRDIDKEKAARSPRDVIDPLDHSEGYIQGLEQAYDIVQDVIGARDGV